MDSNSDIPFGCTLLKDDPQQLVQVQLEVGPGLCATIASAGAEDPAIGPVELLLKLRDATTCKHARRAVDAVRIL